MRIIGAKSHLAHLRRLAGEEMIGEVSKALYAAGDLIKTEAQISITAGAISGKGHVPSKPGQPPSNDTGVLANNIETRLVAPLLVEVSSEAPYAVALEFGTSKMPARPYMRPAAVRKHSEAVQLVREAVSRAVRKTAAGNTPG